MLCQLVSSFPQLSLRVSSFSQACQHVVSYPVLSTCFVFCPYVNLFRLLPVISACFFFCKVLSDFYFVLPGPVNSFRLLPSSVNSFRLLDDYVSMFRLLLSFVN